MEHTYAAHFAIDVTGYLVIIPDLFGYSASGATLDAAMAAARDAVAKWLCGAEDRGEAIPLPEMLIAGAQTADRRGYG